MKKIRFSDVRNCIDHDLRKIAIYWPTLNQENVFQFSLDQ